MLAAPVSERPLEERPPGWLMVAKRRLADDPGVVSVERLAAECGLHRVHFSRSFTAHLGVRPSVFRRRSMVARALALTLIDGLPLAEAALAAGFADQAHLTRAVRGICGMPLGRLRALLAA
jgi:AraC family transcriptional regulator